MRKTLAVATSGLDERQSCGRQSFFSELHGSESVTDFYDFGEAVHNAGDRGMVSHAVRRTDKEEVIVKTRRKRNPQAHDERWREMMTLLGDMCGSRHVLRITEILEDADAFYVVMPRCEGGELFTFLVTEAEVPEAECKRIVKEILAAVGHLHEYNIVHRDIKPENILFDVNKQCLNSLRTVKLIDFDTCTEWSGVATPKQQRFVGTPGYIAPEALLGEVTPQSDLWSIGVILYILMTGLTPWTAIETLEDGTVGSPGAKRLYKLLKRAKPEWDTDPWPQFPHARDLCQKLMAFKMADRIGTAHEALAHPWLSGA